VAYSKTQGSIMTDHSEFGLDYYNKILPVEKLAAIAASDTEKFQQASPFPHFSADDFFPAKLLEKVAEEFPEKSADSWQIFDNLREKKLASNGDEVLGPYTRALISNLNSGTFIHFLESLTGIKGLLADPHLLGGGMHRILPGGKLAVHIDFNKHEKLHLARRLNVLIYLNKDWDESFGGFFELWYNDMQEAKVKFLPKFIRLVLFARGEKTWHGHPDPLTCPADRSRRSIALYYYTAIDQNIENEVSHSTIFRERPNEHLSTGAQRKNIIEVAKNIFRPVINKVFKSR
jgi:Rps23 Pro-64 3,4-dihydroxylase Tpa1-like proline 4-hydroxylase